MVDILFGLFLWNNNRELRKIVAITSPPWNSRITTIFTILEQQIYVWMHNYYSYFENNGYSAIPDPSKHTLKDRLYVCLRAKIKKLIVEFEIWSHVYAGKTPTTWVLDVVELDSRNPFEHESDPI
jgi:hypothetical protein